jgi:outer membrane lipoprotein LolB
VKFTALLGLIFMVVGCAMQPTVPGTSVHWDQRRDRLLQLEQWSARGRIAVKHTDGGGQGRINWSQVGSDSRIQLSGPFGTGAYEIAWNAEHLVVTAKDGTVQAAYAGRDAARQFLDEQLGWSFPAVSTRYWILGVPDPDFASRERFDDEGWLTGIEQNGWIVVYDGFAENDELWLPRKIVMENENARVKVVVDHWSL